MRTIKYSYTHNYKWIYARDHVGLLAQIIRDDDTKEYYIKMVKGIGQSHYEKTLKDAKRYLENL